MHSVGVLSLHLVGSCLARSGLMPICSSNGDSLYLQRQGRSAWASAAQHLSDGGTAGDAPDTLGKQARNPFSFILQMLSPAAAE